MVLSKVSPVFPIEIFEEIGCFAAGENNFGTLAALSVTSRLMSQELKRVLYETIVWDTALIRRFVSSDFAGQPADEIRHVKWASFPSSTVPPLICSGRFFLGFGEQGSASEVHEFPNMHATLKQELDPVKAYPNHTVPPRYTAVLQIWRNTSLATLSSLLRYPLEWEFIDGQTTRSAVLGITSAYVSSPAAFTLGQPDNRGFFTPFSAGIRQISFWKGEEDEGEQRQQKRRETSIRTLSQLSSSDVPLEDKIPGRNQLDVQCDEPADAKAWLREVRRFDNSWVTLIQRY
jgi:hypothetical protein